ncbi:MAG: DUF1643 domain-containing protein [Alphaproteobacteria bacterium]|nr:DUF1643 domain-containing protein [Alphaproteobacteria bacterium]
MEAQPPLGKEGVMKRSATFSDCGKYRYRLDRDWSDMLTDNPRRALWIMLNPSTADASEDDPTIRRIINFSKREGCSALTVLNLSPRIATDPAELAGLTDDELMGDADQYYSKMDDVFDPELSPLIICAWGATAYNKKTLKPWANKGYGILFSHLSRKASQKLLCLGHTKDGAPRHPLYVDAEQPLLELARRTS